MVIVLWPYFVMIHACFIDLLSLVAHVISCAIPGKDKGKVIESYGYNYWLVIH